MKNEKAENKVNAKVKAREAAEFGGGAAAAAASLTRAGEI